MSRSQSFRKGQIVAISALFAATLGFFGCGDDSSSGGNSTPSGSTPTCTVSKSSNAVTVKMSAEGVNTTIIYAFNKDGKMTSETEITTLPDEGNAAAKAACKAMDQDEDGVEVEFEDGACTVTTTKGLEGTLDKTYKAMLATCEEFKENGGPSEKEEKEEPSKTIANLTKLYSTKCAKSNADEIVAVKDESYNYICAKIDLGVGEATYMWAPVVDDIDDMPKCTKKWATDNPKQTYAYDQSEETIYTCSMDENSKWKWSAVKANDKKDKDGDAEGDDDGDDEDGEESGDDENGDDENDGNGDDENGDDEGDTNSSSSSDKAKSSSSAKADDKSVTFKDDVIWDPSYGSRARTFFNTVGEDNFLEDTEKTGDSSGWWFKYLDDDNNGTSSAIGKFTTTSLDLTITLNYKGWHLEGSGTSAYLAPNPYPYAGFGFSWSPNGEAETVDLSDWEGICMIYEASDAFEVSLQAEGDGGFSWYYPASMSTSTKTINIDFASLTRSIYADENFPKTTALTKVTSLQIKYTNDESHADQDCDRRYNTASECNSYGITANNTIKIYRIGKYGTCSGVNTTL